MFDTISILGTGLIGGSLLKAIREKGLCKELIAWDFSLPAREACEQTGLADNVTGSLQKAVETADLVIVCAPVTAIVSLLQEMLPFLKREAVITDVGSTKSGICKKAKSIFKESEGPCFVGAHPMAGSEKSGIVFSRADLFDAKFCFVMPGLKNQEARVVRFWKSLGMRVSVVEPEEHDRIVAYVSHVPHLMASALCILVGEKEEAWGQYVGRGFLSTTRVASADAELWKSIVVENSTAIVEALDELIITMKAFRDVIQKEPSGILHGLEAGKAFRDKLLRD